MKKYNKNAMAFYQKYGDTMEDTLFAKKTTAEVSSPTPPLVVDDDIPKKKYDAFDNNIEIYHKRIKPGLSNRQLDVLNAVKMIQPCTMHQVRDFLHTELHRISGRFGELVTLELLEVVGKTEDGKSRYKIKQA